MPSLHGQTVGQFPRKIRLGHCYRFSARHLASLAGLAAVHTRASKQGIPDVVLVEHGVPQAAPKGPGDAALPTAWEALEQDDVQGRSQLALPLTCQRGTSEGLQRNKRHRLGTEPHLQPQRVVTEHLWSSALGVCIEQVKVHTQRVELGCKRQPDGVTWWI